MCWCLETCRPGSAVPSQMGRGACDPSVLDWDGSEAGSVGSKASKVLVPLCDSAIETRRPCGHQVATGTKHSGIQPAEGV